MASKNSFKNKGTAVPTATATNYSGRAAYKLESEHALAQLAVTGCFNNTYYTTAEQQLQQVIALARECEPEFVAKVAVYARESGFMKDMPASLIVYLTTVDMASARKAFPKVINNGKMLRNFVQILRSGAFGRHNVSAPAIQRMIHGWFDSRSEDDIFRMSIGNNPSFGDIVKLGRPVPKTKERSALYAWLIGKERTRFGDEIFAVENHLSEKIKAYEAFVKNPTGEVPDVPFEMATGLQLSPEGWKTVARRASWFQTFRSVNTFARQGVLKDKEMVKFIADKIRNPDLVRKATVFPYQILMAYKAIVDGARGDFTKGESLEVPREIAEALQDAMEVACENIPTLDGEVVICPDVSGSMTSGRITGDRMNPKTGKVEAHSTQVRCIDVAALVGAALMRQNRTARVIPFDGDAHTSFKLNPRDSIMTNAQKLASFRGGATNCAAPLAALNKERAKADFVIFISDYESWTGVYGRSRGTPMMEQWELLRARNPNAKLACIDLTPHNTMQTPSNREDILNVGGFSDKVFDVVSAFAKGSGKDAWVKTIKAIEL